MLCALYWIVAAVPHVVRVGSVEDPTLSVRFGPKSDVFNCEVKTDEVNLQRLAIRSRWALLSRHCKSFTAENWNYHLCFGGVMTRFQYGGHARISLGIYEETLDSYTDGYFVQHYVDGTRLSSAGQNRSAEVRCYCGKTEPTILAVDYDNHTVIKVEMPSCCLKVEVEDVINALPGYLSFDPRIGQRDYRFPGATVQSVRIEFSKRRFILNTAGVGNNQLEFTIGTPQFVSRIPAIALGPLTPRGTLRSSLSPALVFPLAHAPTRTTDWSFSDDFSYGATYHFHDHEAVDMTEQDTPNVVSDAPIVDQATPGNSGDGDGNAAPTVKGGIFWVCQELWNTNISEEMVILRQAQYVAGAIPEVYVILESPAFCAFHQLLPRPVVETAIRCQTTDPTTISRLWF